MTQQRGGGVAPCQAHNLEHASSNPAPASLVPGVVPCNGCTRCCHNDAIRLLPGDDATQYRTESHPYFRGELMLAHDSTGACVYLTDSGCSIHAKRTQQCREMDCRLLNARMTFTEARKARILPVWLKGGELMREALTQKALY